MLLDVRPDYLELVREILQRLVPDREVWAFGSRVKWTARDTSDLDLCIVGDTPLGFKRLGQLRDAFSESSLPYKVDVVDWATTSESFRRIIEQDKVVAQSGSTRAVLAGEWVETTLGAVTDFLSGGTPSKGQPEYWGGSIPWVSAKDMKRFRLDDTEDHVTEHGVDNGTKLVPVGTVLLLTRGMTLLNDLPICITRRPMTFNQDVKALRPKPHVRDDFLPYLLLGNKERLLSLVDLAGHGTGRLNSDELKALDVLLPPQPEQRAIAHILGTLDDKIELNRRMNETLEAMARALFKSWFVDFDPVRAKAEGRDPGLPKPVAKLFPARLVDSALGEIPEGWGVGTLAEFSSLNPEAWSKETRPAVINYVDLSNTKWGRIETATAYAQQDAPSRAQRVLRTRDTIVGTVRPGNGSYAFISEDWLTGSTGFAVLRPLRVQYAEFVYLAATAAENIEALSHLADGGAYPAVRPEVVAATKAVKSGDNVIERFSRVAEQLLAKMAENERESRILATLRDNLLPKLISGDLRVKAPKDFEA